MRENKDYLITEKPSRALLIFSIPMIIGNLFQQAYTIMPFQGANSDCRFYVGRCPTLYN